MRYTIPILLFLPSVALAFMPEDMRPEAEFGQWTVLCENLDDMGGVLYLDCAARAADGVFVRAVEGQAMLIVAAGAGTEGIALQPCEWGQCSAAMTGEEMVGLIDAGVGVDGMTLDGAGLSDALAEMFRLLK